MTVTLCGKEYPLHFTVNALCCLEEKTGKGLSEMQSGQMSCLRGLLWCALSQQNPGMTLEDAGNMMDRHLREGGSLASLSEQLAAALEDACLFPRPETPPPPAPSGPK